ncbi:hypothetical protein M0804_012407 [Polistes exclamans]|nr:hypothetical protein M0804_012407 [Polistes exclamans]
MATAKLVIVVLYLYLTDRDLMDNDNFLTQIKIIDRRMDVPIVGKSELGGKYEAGIRPRLLGSCCRCRHWQRRRKEGRTSVSISIKSNSGVSGGSKLTEVDRFAKRKRERKKKKKKKCSVGGRWTKRGREGGGGGGRRRGRRRNERKRQEEEEEEEDKGGGSGSGGGGSGGLWWWVMVV